MRQVGVIAAGIGCVCLAPAPIARAAHAHGVEAARVAGSLAAIIRHDAREEQRASSSAVTVTRRCCGIRVLRVHYGVKLSHPLSHSSYVLRVETKRGTLDGVAVFASAIESSYRSGVKTLESSSQFAFAIHRTPHHVWSTVVSYQEVSQGSEVLNGHPGGLGFARECVLRAAVPRVLYAEVLRTLKRARGHRAFAPEGLALSVCLTA